MITGDFRASGPTARHVARVVDRPVLGTFAVSAGELIAYRVRWIRVTRRFFGFALAAVVGSLLLLTSAKLLLFQFGAGDGHGFDSGT